MPPIHVAVCTNRDAAALAACLEALAGQRAELRPMLVLNAVAGPAADALTVAARAALPGVDVLVEPRPGLSHARNLALAARADDDVLAFIDDDVVVGPDWAARLAAAWTLAPARVACIGGPIRPRFADGDPPGWLSDPLLPALTVLDYGPAAVDLDPRTRTVYGANISFRCGPLRQVGGFDPAYGHRGRRTWFSEEDEAERALARAGFAIRYAPEPWVWHVIPAQRLRRRTVIGRRFRYGATLGARGARSRRLALRQGLRSAAGAPLAALRGDERVAMVRAVRAAENAGVLLAPLLARR